MKCACRVISIFWIVLYRFLQRIRYIPLDLCLARGGSANDLDNLSQLLHWAGLFLRGRSTKGMIDARTVLLARFSAPFFVLSRPVWVCFVWDSLSSIILRTIHYSPISHIHDRPQESALSAHSSKSSALQTLRLLSLLALLVTFTEPLSPWWNFQPPSLSPSHAGGAAPNRWPSTTSGPASFHSLPLPLLANLPAACTAESECRPVQLPARGSRGFPTAWHGAASTHCLTHPPCTQEPTCTQPSTHLLVQKTENYQKYSHTYLLYNAYIYANDSFLLLITKMLTMTEVFDHEWPNSQ